MNSTAAAAHFDACRCCLSACKRSLCVPATPQFRSLGKSVSPEKLLPVGARTASAPYGKRRFNNQMRRPAAGERKVCLPQFFESACNNRALILLVIHFRLKKVRTQRVILIVIKTQRGLRMRISCRRFLSSHINRSNVPRQSLICVTGKTCAI